MGERGLFINITFEDGRTLCLDAELGKMHLVRHTFKMPDGRSVNCVRLADLLTVKGAREITPEAMPADTKEVVDAASAKEALKLAEERRLEMFPELKGKG